MTRGEIYWNKRTIVDFQHLHGFMNLVLHEQSLKGGSSALLGGSLKLHRAWLFALCCPFLPFVGLLGPARRDTPAAWGSASCPSASHFLWQLLWNVSSKQNLICSCCVALEVDTGQGSAAGCLLRSLSGRARILAASVQAYECIFFFHLQSLSLGMCFGKFIS